MKKINLLLSLLFLSFLTFAQKPLSPASISEFASSCQFQAKYNQNGNFMLVTLMQHIAIKVGGIDQAYQDMISVRIDKDARNAVFEAFYSLSGGNKGKLYTNLFDWGVTDVHAAELAGYIISKFEKMGSVTSAEVKSSLFTGTKTFTDEDKTWKYVVTINGNKATILLYSGENNTTHNDHKKVKEKHLATIKGTKFFENGKELGYKYENGVFSELNNEGGWNDYPEVTN